MNGSIDIQGKTLTLVLPQTSVKMALRVQIVVSFPHVRENALKILGAFYDPSIILLQAEEAMLGGRLLKVSNTTKTPTDPSVPCFEI